jgi:hypothetical protein
MTKRKVRKKPRNEAVPVGLVLDIINRPDYDEITLEDRINKMRYGDGVPVLRPPDYWASDPPKSGRYGSSRKRSIY